MIDIKNPRLQNIYNSEMDDLTWSITELKNILESQPYKFELLICFWVSLHLNKLEYAQFIHKQDPLFERVIANMRKLGRTFLIEDKEKKAALADKLNLNLT